MLVCVITTPSEKPLSRKTLASRIVELTNEGNLLAAQELAQYEKILSNTERLARRYYDKADEMEAAMRGKRLFKPLAKDEFAMGDVSQKELEALKAEHKAIRDEMVAFFLEAVDSHDGQAILDLANAVWFFKDKRQRNFQPADAQRLKLLELKKIFGPSNVKFTVFQVAAFLKMDDLRAGKKT